MRKISGFTLAEVLITLGIIGVVAAMTMPTLMNSTQGAQYKAAYKKALSALSQAVTLNVALDDWSFADADNSTYKLESMLKERMNVVRTETGTFVDSKDNEYKVVVSATGKFPESTQVTPGTPISIGTNNVTLFFNDGIMFTFDPTVALNCTREEGVTSTSCYGFIDVNGIKAPNRLIQCDNSDADKDNCDINNATDVYPVVFYDQTVLPNSVAARAVLYSK